MQTTNQQIDTETNIAFHPTSQGTELLQNRGIADYIERHQGAAESIRRAAELLSGKPDAFKSLSKLLPALTNKTVNVFFSYKAKDEKTARAVVDILRKNSAGKLAITYQAEFTENITGKLWREKINAEIGKANWFILLLPDPSDDWDWCLFETGLFEGQLSSADRLICLHHPDVEIPDPIEGYHAIAARPDEVEKFLRMVFIKENPLYGLDAINPALSDSLPEIANSIVDAISPPLENLSKQPLMPWIELCVLNPESMEQPDDLNSATIRNANREALELFDFLDQPKTWGDLVKAINSLSPDDRWCQELFHVIRKIGSGRRFEQTNAVFNTAMGKICRPIICSISRFGKQGKIDAFQVGFVEEVGAINTSQIPTDLSALSTMLRYAFRFRWEILEKFGHKDLYEDDLEALENALYRIEHDTESRGVVSEEAVTSLFISESEANEISQMYSFYRELRNPERTGKLDIAIRKKDTGVVEDVLQELLPLNKRFLNMTAERFGALVSTTP